MKDEEWHLTSRKIKSCYCDECMRLTNSKSIEVSRYTRKKPVMKEYRLLCPFHAEELCGTKR